MALLLFLALTLGAGSQAEVSVPDPELSSVPEPMNLTFEAFNLNTVLHWKYPVMSPTPVFTVEVKTYRKGKWIQACSTSHHYCDISSQIDDPTVSLWARVRARLGQKESKYVKSKEFILCREGKIGPPTVDIRREKDTVITHIFDPLMMVNEEESEVIYDEEKYCYTFFYKLYVETNENETETIDVVDCNDTQCFISFPVSSLNSKYCVSAKGKSDRWDMSTEESEKLCILISHNDDESTEVWISVLATSMFILGIFIVAICIRKKINPFKKESIILPKSLLSVIKSPPAEPKPYSKYISPITYQPILLENKKVTSEQLSPATILDMHAESNPEKVEHREELPSETEVLNTQTDTSNMTANSSLTMRRENSLHSSSNLSESCSVALKAYHSRNGSDSGLVESESLLSDSEFTPTNITEMKTEQESIVLTNTTTSFGYDKPHVLVDLLVDDNGKESLIGYRLTTDSKEFS